MRALVVNLQPVIDGDTFDSIRLLRANVIDRMAAMFENRVRGYKSRPPNGHTTTNETHSTQKVRLIAKLNRPIKATERHSSCVRYISETAIDMTNRGEHVNDARSICSCD